MYLFCYVLILSPQVVHQRLTYQVTQHVGLEFVFNVCVDVCVCGLTLVIGFTHMYQFISPSLVHYHMHVQGNIDVHHQE